MRRALLVWWPTLLLSVLPAQQSLGKVVTVQLPKELELQAVHCWDLNGDGRRDLLLATSPATSPASGAKGRTLRIHLRRPGEPLAAFAQEPDAEVALPRDVTAFAVGDVDASPGNELIFFSAHGAYACSLRAEGKHRISQLVAADFLWQRAHPTELIRWQAGVLDLDADGLCDLLLPEPQGYCFALQRRDEGGQVRFEPQHLELPVPAKEEEGEEGPSSGSGLRANRSRMEFSLALSNAEDGEDEDERMSLLPFLDIEEAVPAPQLQDFDGDGDLDLCVLQGNHLLVWIQTEGGRLEEKPSSSLVFPVTREQSRLDLSFHAQLSDLDGDRRADCLVLAKDRDAEDVRSQILLYLQSRSQLFGEKGIPDQLLLLAGFAVAPGLLDVDGDGRLDFVVGSMRLDLIDQMRSAGNEQIDIELYVYRNLGGRFSKSPDLRHKIAVQASILRADALKLFARFLGDVTGDGISELLLRDRPTRVQLMLCRRQGEALRVFPRPIFEISVAAKADIQILPPSEGERPGFLVLEDRQVLHVEF